MSNDPQMPETIDFAIIMTSGSDTPKRVASPFFLAATAAAMEMNVVVYFTGQGTLLLKKGEAAKTFPKKGGYRPNISWIRRLIMGPCSSPARPRLTSMILPRKIWNMRICPWSG